MPLPVPLPELGRGEGRGRGMLGNGKREPDGPELIIGSTRDRRGIKAE